MSPLAVVCVLTFLHYVGAQMRGPVLPLYAAAHGATATGVGAIVAAHMMIAAVNRTNPATKVVLSRAAEAAAAMRLGLVVVDAPSASALDRSFDAIVEQRSEALVLVADPMLFGQRRRIIEFAARQRLPAVYEYRLFPELGGLLSYGPDPHERYRRAAVYVDRILRGAQPGELPVEQPSSFELVLNLKTAKAIALTIPPSLLLRADQVIE